MQKPRYSTADIEAAKAIHRINPKGVCRVRLEWNESKQKWDKHPVAHWEPKSLRSPAHAHWPILQRSLIDSFFNGEPYLRGIGISCHKFGMVGIDLDEGNPSVLVDLVKKRCGAEPLGQASTQRGHRIYYQVSDSDRYNEIVGWSLDGFDGKGEILLYTQYDYVWDPISTKNAIMANIEEWYKGPPIDLSIFKSVKRDPAVLDPARISSSTDAIDAITIAETYDLVEHPEKEDTWRGACPFCGEGETRFEVTQGDIRPLIKCWVCDAGKSPEDMRTIYKKVKSTHPNYAPLCNSIDKLVNDCSTKKAEEIEYIEKEPVLDKSDNQQQDTDLVIRTRIGEDGSKITTAFVDEEEVAVKLPAGWILNLPAGQKIWSGVVGLSLVETNIRKVRFGQYPQFSKDGGKTWNLLNDTSEAKLWIEVERNVFIEKKTGLTALSPSTETRRDVMNAMLDNEHDPVRDWLDDLEDWDGTPRLDTHMADLGMTISAESTLSSGKEIDLAPIAQSYIPLEIVRLTYHPGSQRNPMPVFRGHGGEGKSSYGQRILPPSLQEDNLYTADYKLTMTGQQAGQLLSKVKVCELREFGINKFSDLDDVKSAAMAESIDYRVPWGKRPVTLLRHDACYVTTNQGNLPGGQPALHRRFWYCNVTGKAKTVHKEAWTGLNDTITLKNGRKSILRNQIFAEAKHRVLNSPNPQTYCEVPALNPEEFMEHNMKMGGVYFTPGEDFQDLVDNTIDSLIEEEVGAISIRDMKAAIVCVDQSREIMSAKTIEAFAEEVVSSELSRTGAREMLRVMGTYRNDSVKQAVRKNSEERIREEGSNALRYEWKRGKYAGKGKPRSGSQFQLTGNLSANMIEYQDILKAVDILEGKNLEVNEENVAKILKLDPAILEDSVSWERFLIYN